MTDRWLEFCKSYIPKVKARHLEMLHRPCELENPRRFTDKLEWLKIYDSTYLKSYCADKYTVRQYVKAKIGKDICIPLLGVYNSFVEVDFSALPTNYVLKTNHGSHTNIIVRDGVINKQHSANKFKEWLSKDWSWWGYELHYIPIPRKIIAEPFMNSNNKPLIDYKIWCFNGLPKFIGINGDGGHGGINFYDLNGTLLPISNKEYPSNPNLHWDMPKTLDVMIQYASILCRDFKFVRIDLYEIDSIPYIGELTFIPGAGYIQYQDPSTDYKLGDMLTL